MLREIADAQAVGGEPRTGSRREFAGDRTQQRRFTGPVRAEKADALAGQNRPVDVLEHGRPAIAETDMLELQQLPRGRRMCLQLE